MKWGERWRVARTLYRELSFQSIYALKSGNTFLRERKDVDPGDRAERRILQSKITVCVLFGLTALASAALVSEGRYYIPTALTPMYFDATIFALSLVVIFSLVWITGLQVALPFLSSQALTALRALPIEEEDLEGISALAFLHLFDLPLTTAFVLFPVAIFLATGSALAALASLPAIAATEVFALSLSLVTAGFFARTVSGSTGGSLRNLLARWTFLILWTVPSLAITIFIVFSVQILGTLGQWELVQPGSLALLFGVFPFPFAWVIASAAIPTTAPPAYMALWTVALGAYSVLLILAGEWLLTAPLRLGRTVAAVAPSPPRSWRLRTTSPTVAVLAKDLRIASRTPAYAFLLLLPLLDAFVLGLFTYLGNPNPAMADRYASAAVTVAVLLSAFFGPVFFATEVMGFSLTRTLPLTQRTLMMGKSALITIVYIIAFLLVALLVASRIHDFPIFLLFGSAELPAIVAAALLEMGILVWRAEKTGVPLTSLYSGAWWVTMVSVPGLLVAGTPLIAFHFYPSVPLMAVLAIGLLVPVAVLTLRGANRTL